MLHNFSYIQENFWEFAFQGYTYVLGFLFYPVFFSIIIAYVFVNKQSLTAAAIVILSIFAVFGNALLGVELWVNLMYIVVSLIVTILVLVFLTKRRG